MYVNMLWYVSVCLYVLFHGLSDHAVPGVLLARSKKVIVPSGIIVVVCWLNPNLS